MGNIRTVATNIRIHSVHPHARGEHNNKAAQAAALAGSSPRTWGTSATEVVPIKQIRFIPTHVGNIVDRVQGGGPASVHPHARGGTCESMPLFRLRCRFIPTHVGNMQRDHSASCQHGSSPRTWGTSTAGAAFRKERGSSPRTWGTYTKLISFSPATGSSPRTWGTSTTGQTSHGADLGSSPRTWGTSERNGRIQIRFRFIPTHVNVGTSVPPRRQDGKPGSSPRTWGNMQNRLPDAAGWTVHPHRTWGTFRLGLPGLSASAVHPHARGEHIGRGNGQ